MKFIAHNTTGKLSMLLRRTMAGSSLFPIFIHLLNYILKIQISTQ